MAAMCFRRRSPEAAPWRPPCRTIPAWQKYEGGAVQSFREADCPTPKGRLYVIGDSHAGAYAGMVRLFASTTGREVFVFTRGGCNLFSLREPMSSDIEPCRRFVAATLARLQSELSPADILFLPGLRVTRLRDQWGGARPESPPRLRSAKAARL